MSITAAGGGVIAVDRDHRGAAVRDDQTDGQGGRSAGLSAQAAEPFGIGHGVRAVADAVEIDGTHTDSPTQQGLVQGLGGFQVRRRLLPVRGQDHDLVLHLALQQVQPLPDAVQADQVLDTGLGDRRAQIRVFGDELCGGCPRGLDPVLLSGEFGLLAGEQDLHADVRADRTEPAALLVRGPSR
ncbi:hypothetical protein AB0O88_24135 [Streptomyces microflavus]